MDVWKWLYPGMGVKRWLLVMACGVLCVSGGFTLVVDVSVLGTVERGVAASIGRLVGGLPRRRPWRGWSSSPGV